MLPPHSPFVTPGGCVKFGKLTSTLLVTTAMSMVTNQREHSMQTILASEFTACCLALIDEVARSVCTATWRFVATSSNGPRMQAGRRSNASPALDLRSHLS